MSKYNEIMEHIELTDEMRERIINNVSANQKRRRISRYIRIGTAAAACIVIVFSTVIVMKNTEILNKNPDSGSTVTATQNTVPTVNDTYTYGASSYDSAAELSEDFGIEIHDITKLPFEVNSASYSIMFDSFAEVDYYGKNNEECCFRVGKDAEDITGEYYEFTTIETTELNDIEVTLKGYGQNYHIASWISDDHFYSVSLSKGTDKDSLLKIVKEIME